METIVLFTKTLVFKRVQLWKRAQHTARRAGVLSKLYQPIWATPSPLGHGVFPFSWIYTMKHETIAKYQLHRHLERNQQSVQRARALIGHFQPHQGRAVPSFRPNLLNRF